MALRNISVDGSGGAPVLYGVSLVVAAGSTVAVVGKSGVGKTTLASLIGRLADPDRGTVAIDGTDIHDLRFADLGRLVGYAFERPFLLGDTIADTIRCGRSASDEEVVAAAHRAHAHTFIERLPQSYQTPLASAPFSGGELQRLGLARLALKKTRIVILDDALSSLDIATESRVTHALENLGGDHTTVMITHRVSTAAAADRVVWVEGDHIRGIGSHASLWADADYRRQFGIGGRHS